MSPQVGCGPHWRIDGPPPLAPVYGLLQAAGSGAPSVRINPVDGLLDADQVERWLNGVEVFPYPPGPAYLHDTYQSGSIAHDKEFGDENLVNPLFGPITAYIAESCTAASVWNQEAYRARAIAALAAVESAAYEREFLAGDVLPLNPHLSDGNGTFPWGDNATTVVNALAMLENEIARVGKQGVIHCSPAYAVAVQGHLELDNRNGVVRTINGTVVIPGAGYVFGATPTGHAEPANATQEWVYATGLIDVRRSAEVVMLPGDVREAVDRGMGATTGRPNTITYRAERYALVSWDTEVQAAVLADRCTTDCGTPPA